MKTMRMSRNDVWIFKLAATLLLSLIPSSSASLDSFIYVGCTQLKFSPGSPYQSSIDSVLASLVNSASLSNFNKYNNDAVYGLFQCRGDLTSSDCHSCVANAASRMGSYCAGMSGAALQLDGCYVKYDNTSFVGEQDKTVVYDKCGATVGYESDLGTRRDELLAYLMRGGQYFRVGGSGIVQGMAQCVQDLSAAQCQNCLSDATQRLQTECSASTWGDMFLGKCYARYSQSGSGGGGESGYTPSERDRDDNDETEKTLALIIGIIAAVTLLVIFLSFLSKREDGK